MKKPTECENLWEALCALADSSAGADSERLRAHLRDCPLCVRDLEVLRQINSSFGFGEPPYPPHNLRDRILAATVNRPSLAARLRAISTSIRLPAYGRFAVASAACAVLLFAVSTFSSQNDFALTPEMPAANPVKTLARLPSDVQAPHRFTTPGIETDRPAAVKPARLDAPHESASAPLIIARTAPPRIAPEAMAATARSVAPVSSDSRRIEMPEPEKAAPPSMETTPEPRLERESVDPPVAPDRPQEPARIARAEERPLPEPETKSMYASSGSGQAAYTMEAKSTMDPGAVATLADLRRTLNRETESDQAPGAFRKDDLREVRLSVHTSRF